MLLMRNGGTWRSNCLQLKQLVITESDIQLCLLGLKAHALTTVCWTALGNLNFQAT